MVILGLGPPISMCGHPTAPPQHTSVRTATVYGKYKGYVYPHFSDWGYRKPHFCHYFAKFDQQFPANITEFYEMSDFTAEVHENHFFRLLSLTPNFASLQRSSKPLGFYAVDREGKWEHKYKAAVPPPHTHTHTLFGPE